MLGHESSWGIYLKCAFWGSFIGVFADITANLSIISKMLIPVIDGADGGFGLEYFSGDALVILIDGLIHLFLLDCEVTFAKTAWVVASIAVFLDLVAWACHDIGDAVDESLILTLHIVFFEVGHFFVVFGKGPGGWTTAGFDHGSDISEIGVVAGFILKVEELLCLLYVH